MSQGHLKDSMQAAQDLKGWLCRDTLGTCALFLYRKVVAPSSKVVLVEAAPYDASEEVMDAWLKGYLAALDSTDPSGSEEPGNSLLPTTDLYQRLVDRLY